ncbi:MAG TPA: DMT family transporter [Thermoanaerobaculia bacterium]|nr:DMT family transporter [Thermoanaerobaculia bacterium]
MTFPPRLGVLLAVVLWGVSFVATKAALAEISPVTLIFTRFLLGSVLLVAIVWLRGASPIPPRDALPALALMGFVGIFVHQLLQAYGLSLTTATHAGWLIGLTPIWSAVLAAIALRERFGAIKILGLLGGFTGALLVVTRGEIGASVLTMPSTRGDLLILISTFNWALYSTIGHRTIRRLGPTRATAGGMVLGTLMLAPLFVIRAGWRELPHLSGTGTLAVLFLGICCSGLGYLFWYGALERIEVSRAAVFLYLEPLVTFVAALILLHEPVRPITIAGGIIVLLSVVAMQYAKE